MDTNTTQQFKKVIEDIVDAKIENKGITKYVSAIVSAVNSDKTVNVYLPPDNQNIISHLLNKTGEKLSVGDSVELCTKNGKASNAWVAVKHGIGSSGGGFNVLESAKPRAQVTDANTAHTYEDNLMHLRLLPSTVAMTSNKPDGDGYILDFQWDNSGDYRCQVFVANNQLYTSNTRMQIRFKDNSTWSSWDSIGLAAYPVGSIYMSWNSTSPASLFGGTWERIKGGYMYGCVDSSGTSGSGTSTGAASGNTGSTTLTVNQIPSHDHSITSYGGATQWATGHLWGRASNESNNVQGAARITGKTGGSQGHTHSLNSHTHSINYIAVFVWKRTA